jgi:hypothetical protein
MIKPGATLGMIGSYNKNSASQLSLIQSSIPYIKQAIDILDINPSPFPIILADFGSSHGSNSVYVMKLILDYIKQINKTSRSFLIIHNDLPTNDWNSLFNILNQQENFYFGLANGKSFYNQCLPPNSLTIGYTSSSIHWLSRKPCNISNHCTFTYANHQERQAFKLQARDDYRQFLENRSHELIQGGILIINTSSVNDEDEGAFESIYNLLYKCAKLIGLNEEELINYTIPVYLRSYDECIDNEIFEKCSFELIKSDISTVELPFCQQWKKGDMSIDEFAKIHTGLFRCGTESILKQTLEINEKRSKEEIDQLLNRFWQIYNEQIKQNPHEFIIKSCQTYLILKKL